MEQLSFDIPGRRRRRGRAAFVNSGGRICVICDVYKPWGEYYRLKKRGTRGHASECKECRQALVKINRDPVAKAEYARQWREANPQKYQEGQIRGSARRRGLDPDAVIAHFRSHHGTCDICGGTPQGGDRRTSRLCIDHDHVTGAFRGLLCAACNTAIGKFKDDPAILAAAISYLARANQREAS